MTAPAYDRMGVNYSEFRQADPRIETAIWDALGDARSVVNVGAGAGSYEPTDREVVAVEPSARMIAQRPTTAAAVIQASAEELPFADSSFDAAMGVFTVHHWADLRAGLAEMRRVARRRIVLLTVDPEMFDRVWIFRDYFPEAGELEKVAMPPIDGLLDELPGSSVTILPAPGRCLDGFAFSFWDRPEHLLDPEVRRASSVWHRTPQEAVERGALRLRADLESGEWDRRYGHFRERASLDVGLRLIRAELR